MERIVEVSKDALGWLLIYARDTDGCRAGDPVGKPDYFKSERSAARAAAAMNTSGSTKPKKPKSATFPTRDELWCMLGNIMDHWEQLPPDIKPDLEDACPGLVEALDRLCADPRFETTK